MEIHKTTKFLALYAGIGAALRLLPHPPNMAAIGALALFAGAHGKNKWSLIIPLIVMGVTDFFLGFYEPGVMIAVYGTFLVMGLLGRWIRRNTSWERIVGASFAGSVIFFLSTNAAVWAFSPWYSKTIEGLMSSYALALPFFRNTLAGNLLYTASFFGLYAIVEKKLYKRVYMKFARPVPQEIITSRKKNTFK
ncbi:hypothetical protein CL629_03805 [bacterium]|nr:hypothetical protein [bacterium]|tara:strand:+ start:3520 stop:4098 length:579 start_codon:yes stop_codon:yes gene_type:complete